MFLFWGLEISNSNGNQADLLDFIWTSGISGKVILNTLVVARCASERRLNACGIPLHGFGILFSPKLCPEELCALLLENRIRNLFCFFPWSWTSHCNLFVSQTQMSVIQLATPIDSWFVFGVVLDTVFGVIGDWHQWDALLRRWSHRQNH